MLSELPTRTRTRTHADIFFFLFFLANRLFSAVLAVPARVRPARQEPGEEASEQQRCSPARGPEGRN